MFSVSGVFLFFLLKVNLIKLDSTDLNPNTDSQRMQTLRGGKADRCHTHPPRLRPSTRARAYTSTYIRIPTTNRTPISLDRTPRVGTSALPEPCDILPAAPGLSKSTPTQDSPSPLSYPLQSVQSQTSSTDPISPLAEFQDPENASDREQDRELFHSMLQRIISARRDDEVLQVLGVRPGEVPEALKAFRRAEEALRDATEKQECDIFEDGLKRVCMETGIEAMTRLSSVAVREPEDKDVDVPWDLPPWTITRCVLFQ
jgi:hypothetical protein